MMNRKWGLSIAEICITVAILSVLTVIGTIRWKNSQANLELKQQSQQVERFINEARAEAMRRCTSITITGENGSSLDGASTIVASGGGYSKKLALSGGATVSGPSSVTVRGNGTLASEVSMTMSAPKTTNTYKLTYNTSGSGNLVACAASKGTSSGSGTTGSSASTDSSSQGGSTSSTGGGGTGTSDTSGTGSSSTSGGTGSGDTSSGGSSDAAASSSDGPQGDGLSEIALGGVVLRLTNTFLEDGFLQDKFSSQTASSLAEAYVNSCKVLDQCNALRVGEIAQALASGDSSPELQKLKAAADAWDVKKIDFDNADAKYITAYDQANKEWKSGQLTEDRLGQILTELKPNVESLIGASSGVVQSTRDLYAQYVAYKKSKGL